MIQKPLYSPYIFPFSKLSNSIIKHFNCTFFGTSEHVEGSLGMECLDCKTLLTDLMEKNLSSVVKQN